MRPAERSIHLFAAGSVVPASPLPAYLLPGKFFVVVSLNPDADHARLVHDLLDDFAVLADDFACGEEKENIFFFNNVIVVACMCSDEAGCCHQQKELHDKCYTAHSPTRFLGT